MRKKGVLAEKCFALGKRYVFVNDLAIYAFLRDSNEHKSIIYYNVHYS